MLVFQSCQKLGEIVKVMSKNTEIIAKPAESYHAVDIWEGSGWRFAALAIILAVLSTLILVGGTLSIG